MSIKTLVVGFGFMGQTHAGNLLRNPETELAGIVDFCDPAERLKSVKGNQATVTITEKDIRGIPHFSSLDEALMSSRPDAVVVALPTKFHCPAVVQSLNSGAHVFVEKPLAVNLTECADMIRAAEANTRILAVGQVVRYTGEYVCLKNLVQDGRLGEIRLLRMNRVTGVPLWGNWSDPEFIRASGGALFDLISHDIDFARFCLGEPEAVESVRIPGPENMSLITVTLRYSKRTAVIEGGFVRPSTIPFNRKFSAYFERGTLRSDAAGMLEEFTETGLVLPDFSKDDPYRVELDCFIRAIETGDVSRLCSGRDAMKTVECCHLAGRRIHYPLP